MCLPGASPRAVSLTWAPLAAHPTLRPTHPQVTLAEFQGYYSGLSASVDTDAEFVAMVSSAWRL